MPDLFANRGGDAMSLQVLSDGEFVDKRKGEEKRKNWGRNGQAEANVSYLLGPQRGLSVVAMDCHRTLVVEDKGRKQAQDRLNRGGEKNQGGAGQFGRRWGARGQWNDRSDRGRRRAPTAAEAPYVTKALR